MGQAQSSDLLRELQNAQSKIEMERAQKKEEEQDRGNKVQKAGFVASLTTNFIGAGVLVFTEATAAASIGMVAMTAAPVIAVGVAAIGAYYILKKPDHGCEIPKAVLV